MRITSAIIVLLSSYITVSCTSDSRNDAKHVEPEQYSPNETYSERDIDGDDFDDEGNYEYEDGTYCAIVDYYNPNTGTSSSYTLNVEIESDELIIIYWPNGGWLDESHFSPEDISNGSCDLISDKGYEYIVTIIGENCQYTFSDIFSENEDEEDYLDDLEYLESEEYDEYHEEF